MTRLTSGEWIDHFLTNDPPRHKSLVMTLCGDAIAPHGGAFWLGSMIELLGPLGVSDRLVRTSVFRLVQEGWLVASREGRRSRYALEPRALPRFERANRRIYAPPGLHWDGHWTFVLAPNGSIDGDLRALLRKELEWEGFAMLATGVMAHPAPQQDTLREILARAGAEGKVFVCDAAELPGVGSRPLPELVGDAWDLSAVVGAYRQFIDRFTPLLAQLKGGQEVAPQDAFAIRTLLIHAYRRVQLHDPMLPLELLPDPWPGTDAYQLARDIYRLTWRQAEAHVMAMLGKEDDSTPPAEASFFERFGGLA
ncbi:phenylacetic acid degradation operon negative regulatory protein PaaX [Massilia sp. IC2-476]|uniref:phenylacetic acid degradation operon negative regulatory protein PaaX n=1 Tax=Massilia sp. IC2-476 TaxID=2887199 RepID=UPI001D0FCF21|nr:phenylacetic acid degradation operon negative regulatory protein PaaX [Massilia sp. IC2-476]MCC2973208.1 phenylacetic acid degradation operon negative regulatory protein PaaX [Massilia sp. IC2-476]